MATSKAQQAEKEARRCGPLKDKANGRVSNLLGWITTIAMTVAAAALLLSLA